MSEPQQRFVESQRVPISVWDWGNDGAPVVLLVHGGRDHARSWDRIAAGLRDAYHVVALDLRGHGDSGWTPGGNYGLPDNALDVVRVIESTGSPARVVAHSYGGSISLLAAGIFPEHFSALAALEGTHSLNPADEERVGPAWLRRWADRVRGFETQEAPVYPDVAAAARRMKEANRRLAHDFVPHLAEHAIRPVNGGHTWKYDLWVNARTSMEVRRSELPAFWEAIECPVLLMIGDESHARARQHPDAERHFRSVRSVLIEGAGHWMHHDQPALVVEELRSFLREQ